MIIVIISICILFCIIMISSISSVLTYLHLIEAKKWRCVQIDKDAYVLGRFNNNEAECMYDPKGVGCYIITPKLNQQTQEIDKEDLDNKCSNAIKEYPNVKTTNGVVAMDLYRCGKNSKQYELWNSTGYTNKNDQCYKILENTKMSYIKYFDK